MSKGEIDITGLVRKIAAEGHNPTGLITHVGNHRIRGGAKSKALDEKTKKSIKRNDKKRLHEYSQGRGGTSYESHASKEASKRSDRKYAAYERVRKARYKREGISE